MLAWYLVSIACSYNYYMCASSTDTCAPDTGMNLSLNVSFEETKTEHLPFTVMHHAAAVQLSWQPPPGVYTCMKHLV